MNYANRTAVVTGASSGIGHSLALALAARGARVGAIARRAELLDDLARRARAAGGTLEAAVADVADRSALAGAIRGLEAGLGPADLLIACAGTSHPTGAAETNVAGVEAMMGVNFLGVVYAVEAVLPAMIARGCGHVVGISSLAAYKGLPGAAGYSASKAAVNAYLEALRIELRTKGVAVTAVCPGFVRTPMTAKNPTMPFLLEADDAAHRILAALLRKPARFDFPMPMALLMKLARILPDRVVAAFVPVQPGNGTAVPPRTDARATGPH